jgi:hypothetical protein
MFVVVHLQKYFMLIYTYFHDHRIKFHMLSSKGLFVTAVRLKAEESFRSTAMLL